jgi:hypothetical protein
VSSTNGASEESITANMMTIVRGAGVVSPTITEIVIVVISGISIDIIEVGRELLSQLLHYK